MTSRRLSTVLIDQVVASACTYTAVLLVARGASPSVFGGFLVAFGFLAFTTAVSRASFGVLIGMEVEAGEARPADGSRRAILARSATAALMLGLVAAAVLVLASVVVGGPVSSLLLVLAGATPLAVVLDVLRFHAVAEGRPVRALAADAVWLAPCLTVVLVDILRGNTLAPLPGSLVWLVSLVAAVVAMARVEQLTFAPLVGTVGWAAADRRRRHLAADAAIGSLTPVANGFGAATVAGAAATAAVRGSAAIFAPVATLTSAMALGAVPEARRRAPDAALRLLLRLTALLLAASLLWSLVALLMPDVVGEELLGATWPAARDLLPYVCVEYAGLALWSGATAMLRFAHATRTALAIRLCYAPAAVLLPPLALLVTDDVRAFASTLAMLGVLLGGCGLVVGVHNVRATTPA